MTFYPYITRWGAEDPKLAPFLKRFMTDPPILVLNAKP
jgi:hypothetical protein